MTSSNEINILAVCILWILPVLSVNSQIPLEEKDQVQVKCRAPDVLVRSNDGINITTSVVDFNGVLEVQFLGILPPFHHRRVCKIKCVNGGWVGPLCSIEEDGGRFQPMLRSCGLEQPPPNVLLIYNGKVFWPSTELQFAHGTTLHARCQTLGLYKFVGSPTIRCRNGHWEKRLPSCLATTYLTNFTANAPPSIFYQVASGSASPSDSGDLILYPGSILHLDCIYRRRDGNPQWLWTPTRRQYPVDWVKTDLEKDYKYRLSIYYAKSHDTGTFTCANPSGITNSLSIIIQAVDCPQIRVNTTSTKVITQGYKLNDAITFECFEGHLLVGNSKIICLWTGKWSSDPPVCEVLYCPELIPTDGKLQISIKENTHKGRAQFRCPRGHRIDGPSEISCMNGTWSDVVPVCVAVYCDPPPIPEHGRMMGGEKHLVGDKVQYSCDEGYILVGQSLVFCVGMGTWDNPFPTCRAACEPLKSPENGKISPVREYYEVSESITIVCDNEHIIHGPQKLHCIAPGKWSSALPDCRPFVIETL